MIDTVTDVETTLDIDLDAPVPCEHSRHGEPGNPAHAGPGALLVRGIGCPRCGWSRGLFILCRAAWDHAGAFGLKCSNCGVRGLTRRECWKLVEVL